MTVDHDSNAQHQYKKVPQIVPAIKETKEMARTESAFGAGNYGRNVEFSSGGRGLGECSTSRRRSEQEWLDFSAAGKESKSESQIVSAIKGDQEMARNDPLSASETGNHEEEIGFFHGVTYLREHTSNPGGFSERSLNFPSAGKESESEIVSVTKGHQETVRNGLLSATGDGNVIKEKEFSQKQEVGEYTSNSRRCEEISLNFSSRGGKLEPVREGSSKWSKNQLQIEGKWDSLKSEFESVDKAQRSRRFKERSGEFEEMMEKSEFASEGTSRWSEVLLERKTESDGEIQDSRTFKGRRGNFGVFGEKTGSIPENATKWLETLLQVEGKLHTVGNSSGRCEEMYGNFSTIGENLESIYKMESGLKCVYNDQNARGGEDRSRKFEVVKEKLVSIFDNMKECSETSLEDERRQDPVETDSQCVFTTQDSRRYKERNENFSAIQANLESVSKDAMKWLGDKGKRVVAEKHLSSAYETVDLRKQELNCVNFVVVNEKHETSVKVLGFDSVSKLKYAVENPTCLCMHKKGPSYLKEMQEMGQYAEIFSVDAWKQAALGINPSSASNARRGNGKNEVVSEFCWRSAESATHRNANQSMGGNKMSCYGRRVGLRKQNGMWSPAEVQNVYRKKGKRPKRSYSRCELEAMRYTNGEAQKKRWSEIYLRLAPIVAWELDRIAMHYYQMQGRNAR